MTPDNHSAEIAAKNFLAFQRTAILSTIARAHDGFPFGSIAPYDIDSNGNVFVYVSYLAEHYKNLKLDPKASLFICDKLGFDDPLRYSRATILVELTECPAEIADKALLRYAARFPGAVRDDLKGNFCLMSGSPQRIRWIEGFGVMGWIREEEWRRAALDEISYHGYPAASHMNLDHPSAVRELAEWFLNRPLSDVNCKIIGMESRSITISVSGQNIFELCRIPFAVPLLSASDIESGLRELLKMARSRKPAASSQNR